MKELKNPIVRVVFKRFSSYCGYGYEVDAAMFDNGKVMRIAHKKLHCLFGEQPENHETPIRYKTLDAIEKFCEERGSFWGCAVEKEIDFNKAYQIRKNLQAKGERYWSTK